MLLFELWYDRVVFYNIKFKGDVIFLTETSIEKMKFYSAQEAQEIVGTHDKNLKLIEDYFDVTLFFRGEEIELSGKNSQKALQVLKALQQLTKRGIKITTPDVITALKMVNNRTIDEFTHLYDEELLKDAQGKAIRVKTAGQREYIEKIKQNDIIFGIGPAGTGKTFLAVVMAVAALKRGEVKRIILTRPAVEAGESLGFLPGDLKEKVDPYLRPIYDALYQVFGTEHTSRLMERGVIEIAPLAYMRGRTLDDAFIILDEAQNTTIAQMKMFLTRLGFQSKMIINGDASQVDLPKGVVSGLIDAKRVLSTVKKISFVEFTAVDVVRHPVVAEIIAAYEKK